MARIRARRRSGESIRVRGIGGMIGDETKRAEPSKRVKRVRPLTPGEVAAVEAAKAEAGRADL